MFAFPPWSLIPRILTKLRFSSGVLMPLVVSWWPQWPCFLELLDLIIDDLVQLTQSVRPPTWDLEIVLRYRSSSSFEPLSVLSLRSLMKKSLFFISLATIMRVSALHALACHVSFSSSGACMAYVPEFVAKTESAVTPFLALFLSNPLRILRLVLTRSYRCVQFVHSVNILTGPHTLLTALSVCLSLLVLCQELYKKMVFYICFVR